jgi:hypothetical protein
MPAKSNDEFKEMLQQAQNAAIPVKPATVLNREI